MTGHGKWPVHMTGHGKLTCHIPSIYLHIPSIYQYILVYTGYIDVYTSLYVYTSIYQVYRLVYQVYTSIYCYIPSFARGKPRLGGLSVDQTFERQLAAGEASKERAAENRRRRKAGKA